MIKKYFLLALLTTIAINLQADTSKDQAIAQLNATIDHLKEELVTNNKYLNDNPDLPYRTIAAINKSNVGLQQLINDRERELYSLTFK